MIICSIADQVGRRPVYVLIFSTFILANIELALQTSYPALLNLRMVQGAGGSATLGLGYGVVGDITELSERGSSMCILDCDLNIAPPPGPVLGGVVTQEADWRWTFGLLAIAGGLTLILIEILLPETTRKIAGNNSYPVTSLYKSLLMLWKKSKLKSPESKEASQS